MLLQLAIHDFAIVETLELDFRRGMTAITGETGAGKSILLGALGLCLGERADAGSVRHGAERADIIARFDISGLAEARQWLDERELGSDDCLLRRVITASGRSKAWINGTPCTISDLRELGECLIDIHSQHAHHSLLKEETHLRQLDEYAGLEPQTAQLREEFRQWQDAHRRLKRMSNDGDEIRARRQLLRYQVEELDELALSEGELEALEQEQETLANAEQTLEEAQAAVDCCDHDDEGALVRINQAVTRLTHLPGNERGALASALGMLDEARIQIEEAARELHRFIEVTELDPERLAFVDERLGRIHQIARKHHVMPDELHGLHQRLSEELEGLGGDEDAIEVLREEVASRRDSWKTLATEVGSRRTAAAPNLASDIQDQLAFLGMAKATFEVAIEARERPQPEGMERIHFRISANPGQPPRALAKVASGGELSRVSLAIQVVAASRSTIPSLVFDEVDVGISGATAEIVGQLLRRLGDKGQVLTVTHLPQVAAQAHQHLHIEKQAENNNTRTHMELLDESGRVRELARMLGGIHLSEQTLAHAREMLGATDSRH